MTIIDYRYLRPATSEETIALLTSTERVVLLASGTDVLLKLRYERIRPAVLVDISRIPNLRGMRLTQHDLWLGPLTTLSELAASAIVPKKWLALAEGAAAVGSVQIRNLATVGGNVCNASPAADTIPALLALNAQAELTGPSGQRTLPLDQFFSGPGQTVMQTGELLSGLTIPDWGDHVGSTYLRRCIRRQLDLAVVGVAAAISLNDSGQITQVRLALGAVAPTPIRAYAAEQTILAAGGLNDSILAEAAQLAQQAARPISDLRATAEYRRQMVGVLTRRALQEAYRRAKGLLPA